MDVLTGELEFRDTIAQDFDLPGLLTFVYILSPLFLARPWRSDRRRQCAAADQHTVRGEGISHPVGRQVASRSSARRLEVFQFENVTYVSDIKWRFWT